MNILNCSPESLGKINIDYQIHLQLKKLCKKKKYNYFLISQFHKGSFYRINNTFLKLSFFKYFTFIINAIIFLIHLKNKNKKHSFDLIYLDNYNLFDFVLLSFFSKIIKSNFIVFIRIPYFKIKFLKNLFRISIFNFKHKTIFLTDTLSIKRELKKMYNIESIVFPILNFKKKIIQKNIKISKIRKVYFPGAPREEKGITNLIKLLETNDKKYEIQYVFQKFKHNKKINFYDARILKKKLNYNEYQNFFQKIDFVILPYTHNTYEFRSSGVFIDSILNNRITFVNENIWAAKILSKFNLKDLIIKKKIGTQNIFIINYY